jgi:polygalacturonase
MKKLAIYLAIFCHIAAVAGCKNLPAPPEEGSYRLVVNGKEVEVVPFKHYFYALVEMPETAEMSLTSGTAIDVYEISPLSRNIQSTREGNTINFKIDKPQYIMVRINETERIFIFAEKPEVIPTENTANILTFGVLNDGSINSTEQIQEAINQAAANGQTLLFPAGVYKSGQLVLPSNAHIHISKGATLLADDTCADVFIGTEDLIAPRRCFIFIPNASNVKITGFGAINGNGVNLREKFGDAARIRVVLAANSTDLLVEGVMLKNPGSWNTQIIKCRDVVFRNVKVLNDIELSNTDGINPDATQNMLIENTFGYASDDNIAIKTTNNGNLLADIDGIIVRGNVFLTKKSSLKVGTESRGVNMRNILFEDNDVLESDRGMALYVSDGAHYDNIRYINNRFERNYPDAQQRGIHFRANQRNPDSKLGKMTNILLKDNTFYRAFPRRSEISYRGEGIGIEVEIENLVIEGQRITSAEQADFIIENAKVTFK